MCCNDPKFDCHDREDPKKCEALISKKNYCIEHTEYKPFMLRECANTCGACDYRGESSCMDTTELNCRELSSLCNETQGLGKLVNEQCKWTCGCK
ncbi:unnamed protein product [Toxocara canis]|uniref:ShKT domain-containing protein n=1 Tax=Toxocara canis TaxID=6265 RepID=A0A183VF38_TOXCA|nr:unnamed protein product [Toxocara canis]